MDVAMSQTPQMLAMWRLPIVATVVASATSGFIAEVLPNPENALWPVVTSYILWGIGFSLAMVVLVIARLPTSWPIGQGTFALEQLGKVALKVFQLTHTLHPDAGRSFYIVGHMFRLVIWGYGLVWLFFALASIKRSKIFHFNMGWWGFTFPLGVYAVPTTTSAKDLPSEFFEVLGTVFSLIVVCFWRRIGVENAKRAIKGEIFLAPCVDQCDQDRAEKEAEKELGMDGGDVRINNPC